MPFCFKDAIFYTVEAFSAFVIDVVLKFVAKEFIHLNSCKISICYTEEHILNTQKPTVPAFTLYFSLKSIYNVSQGFT